MDHIASALKKTRRVSYSSAWYSQGDEICAFSSLIYVTSLYLPTTTINIVIFPCSQAQSQDAQCHRMQIRNPHIAHVDHVAASALAGCLMGNGGDQVGGFISNLIKTLHVSLLHEKELEEGEEKDGLPPVAYTSWSAFNFSVINQLSA